MIAETQTPSSAPCVPIEPWRSGLKPRCHEVGTRTLSYLGGALARILGRRAANNFGILMYHRIAPLVRGVTAPPYNVTPRHFRQQVTGLLTRGYTFVSLQQALDCHTTETNLPPKSVVVTFDDCFESAYTQAWPILQELNVPATLFLSTAYLDSDSPFPFDTWAQEFADRVPTDHYRPIRTDQCQEMADSGLIELGTHTHTHADFRQHVPEFAEEMARAAEILQLRFGVDRPCFSLPFGSPAAGYASSELLTAARKSGATCALTTEAALVDVSTDPFGWGRLSVFDWDTSFTLAGKLDGWYDWAPRVKHGLRKLLTKSRAS
jgi:peptidoglycan/xylan/chitin deacetylase (PgdA/CDA1 family)